MPHIMLKIPKGSFSGQSQATLVQRINHAAAIAEQIPADPKKRFFCWIVIEEVEQGLWTCGAADVTAEFLPCVAMVYLPTGVLDEVSRHRYVELIHGAFTQALPDDDKRQLLTSVILQDVADGSWGVNGTIWNLPVFSKAAGFEHLQHLVT
ncbi:MULTISPECIES: tautomerase [unclassified Herbaspirillum]|uniref:tautomerase n=1 Tax=unclassified Herbaspirillum TaxID=2624150 RepID=UPI000E2F63CE|nr:MULTISPECIES: tautomerase [unclassified Herbaspirillum]RFB71167.1 tautomerase [Herbaspirillum sp. 3R-3a1]TFI08304.1 tautomerase [Herbaspirillum sp. 3R11]TFI14719.1 tautomerase [Herbaspirillum sp. 3R-11]TFI31889.1 tautomerase [Herbaspirillum sp. 3C11]TFI32028.1 tautomerase [Herbaspirillum sp. 3C11]